jgi:hypothetical protein
MLKATGFNARQARTTRGKWRGVKFARRECFQIKELRLALSVLPGINARRVCRNLARVDGGPKLECPFVCSVRKVTPVVQPVKVFVPLDRTQIMLVLLVALFAQLGLSVLMNALFSVQRDHTHKATLLHAPNAMRVITHLQGLLTAPPVLRDRSVLTVFSISALQGRTHIVTRQSVKTVNLGTSALPAQQRLVQLVNTPQIVIRPSVHRVRKEATVRGSLLAAASAQNIDIKTKKDNQAVRWSAL